MGEPSEAEKRFEACIPADQQEDVLTAIAEAAQGCGNDDRITILEVDRIDAINVRAQGIIEIDDVEHVFIVEDGNWNGTVLHSWDDDAEFKPAQRSTWALAPRNDLVGGALASGDGKFLIRKWDALLKRPEVSEIPGKYTYDRMMQPGCVIEKHYREAAAKHGFVIVTADEAVETRKRLESGDG